VGLKNCGRRRPGWGEAWVRWGQGEGSNLVGVFLWFNLGFFLSDREIKNLKSNEILKIVSFGLQLVKLWFDGRMKISSWRFFFFSHFTSSFTWKPFWMSGETRFFAGNCFSDDLKQQLFLWWNFLQKLQQDSLWCLPVKDAHEEATNTFLFCKTFWGCMKFDENQFESLLARIGSNEGSWQLSFLQADALNWFLNSLTGPLPPYPLSGLNHHSPIFLYQLSNSLRCPILSIL